MLKENSKDIEFFYLHTSPAEVD